MCGLDVSRDEVFKMYRSKFGRVKGEDAVEYASSDEEGSDEEASDSDEAASS